MAPSGGSSPRATPGASAVRNWLRSSSSNPDAIRGASRPATRAVSIALRARAVSRSARETSSSCR